MRKRNSVINIAVSMSVYFLITLTTLITPGLLSKFLNGNFSNLESAIVNATGFLGIIEMGIGTGIVCKLYRPIQEQDNLKIALILNFYKKSYMIIAAVVFCAGLVMSAIFFNLLIDKDTRNIFQGQQLRLSIAFMLYVLDVLATYLFAHKRAMITADQKNYLINIAHGIAVVCTCVFQTLALLLFKSFELYIIVKVLSTTLESVFVSVMYKKRYSYINLKVDQKLDKREKKDLLGKVRDLFLHKIAGASISTIPGMLISSCNTVFAKRYGWNRRISDGLFRVIVQIFDSVVASFGNLLVTENKKTIFERFKSLYLLNHFIQSFFCVGLYVCITPFAQIFSKTVNDEYFIGGWSLILLVLNFYIMGMRQSLIMVKMSAGIYKEDRLFALMEAAMNIALSIVLRDYLGVNGVLLAGVITLCVIPMWSQPYVVYRIVFKMKFWHYYKMLVLYGGLTFGYICITCFICRFVSVDNPFWNLVIRACISVLVPNVLNILFFWKTSSFLYIKIAISGIFKKILCRGKGCKNEV